MPKKLAPGVRYAVKRKSIVNVCDLDRDRKIHRFVKTQVTLKNDAETESASSQQQGQTPAWSNSAGKIVS